MILAFRAILRDLACEARRALRLGLRCCLLRDWEHDLQIRRTRVLGDDTSLHHKEVANGRGMSEKRTQSQSLINTLATPSRNISLLRKQADSSPELSAVKNFRRTFVTTFPADMQHTRAAAAPTWAGLSKSALRPGKELQERSILSSRSEHWKAFVLHGLWSC